MLKAAGERLEGALCIVKGDLVASCRILKELADLLIILARGDTALANSCLCLAETDSLSVESR